MPGDTWRQRSDFFRGGRVRAPDNRWEVHYLAHIFSTEVSSISCNLGLAGLVRCPQAFGRWSISGIPACSPHTG